MIFHAIQVSGRFAFTPVIRCWFSNVHVGDHLVVFDTEVEDVGVITSDDDLSRYYASTRFGGGSDYQPCAEWIARNVQSTDTVRIYSDGMITMPDFGILEKLPTGLLVEFILDSRNTTERDVERIREYNSKARISTPHPMKEYHTPQLVVGR